MYSLVRPALCALLACILLDANHARALDKQGAAHGGQVAGPAEGVEIGGSLLGGVALYNPSYAARPDNTGLALFRLAPHIDIDLIGHRLSIPIDVNLFSDRRRAGIGKVAPTELDFITGATSTWGVFRGSALELGARYERDMPIDRGRFTQSYADTRVKLLSSAAETHPVLKRLLGANDVTTSATLGYFAYNPSYAARPDNTGRALLRYAAHVDVNLATPHLGLYVDTTFFTDKRTSDKLRPSELDLTLGLALRLPPFEVSITYERDLPIDRGNYTQQLFFLYGSWAFTLFSRQPDAPPPKHVLPAP